MTTREWVGIALFLVALTIAASFMFGNPSGINGAEPTISLGIEPNTPTPIPTESDPPQPVTDLEASGRPWRVTFFAVDAEGERSDVATDTTGTLDYAFAGQPFDTVEDDEWGLVAETSVPLERGRYRITLEAQAEVELWLYGSPVAARGWGPEPEQFEVDFDHPGGQLPIRIQAVDAGGPFHLAWR